MPFNEWHYVEMKVKIDNSAGEFILQVDGVNFLNLTSKDTQNTANAAMSGLFLPDNVRNQAQSLYIDDFYMDNAEFHGDCRVETKFPITPDGNYEQWTRSGGTHNWENVDETPPVTTDYVSGNTAGLIDTYTKAALATTAGTIKGVAANIYCQKTNAGSKQIAGIARLASTDLAGSVIAVPSSWGYLQQFLSKPGGGSWAVADVNSAELGIKLIA